MHGLFLADLGNDWSLAASIETFAIPVGLFVIVATILYFLYTRPHAVPGHRDLVPAGAAAAKPAAGAAGAGGPDTGGQAAAAGGTEGTE
ncbi:MAG TPA: hypothetical protein DHU96_22245 [Actinobacteria bacterium]|nr:hypothetical protein [Actinomycetota bacterium]